MTNEDKDPSELTVSPYGKDWLNKKADEATVIVHDDKELYLPDELENSILRNAHRGHDSPPLEEKRKLGGECVLRTYMCIDLKSFYVSVECVERTRPNDNQARCRLSYSQRGHHLLSLVGTV